LFLNRLQPKLGKKTIARPKGSEEAGESIGRFSKCTGECLRRVLKHLREVTRPWAAEVPKINRMDDLPSKDRSSGSTPELNNPVRGWLMNRRSRGPTWHGTGKAIHTLEILYRGGGSQTTRCAGKEKTSKFTELLHGPERPVLIGGGTGIRIYSILKVLQMAPKGTHDISLLPRIPLWTR